MLCGHLFRYELNRGRRYLYFGYVDILDLQLLAQEFNELFFGDEF